MFYNGRVIITFMANDKKSETSKLKSENNSLIQRNKELQTLVSDIKTASNWLEEKFKRKLQEENSEKEKVETGKKYAENIIKTLNEAVIVIDPEARIKMVNQKIMELTRYKESELIFQPIKTIFVEEEIASLSGSGFKQLLRENSLEGYDMSLKTKTGEKIPVSLSASVMLDKKGKLTDIIALLHDTRALKERIHREKMLTREAVKMETQHNLAAELERVSMKLRELEHIINNSPAIVFLWRAIEGWPVEFVSDNIRLFGYGPEDFYFRRLHFASIVHPDDLERMVDEVKRYNAEGRDSFSQEYRIMTRSGKVRWLSDNTWVRRDADGRITHYQGILMDITDQKKAAGELLQAEKMAAIGLMAASVAHELRNPLAVIRMAVDNIDRRVNRKNREIKRPIVNINRKLEEADKIIKDLLGYSKLKRPVLADEDITSLAKEALSSVNAAYPHGHDFKVVRKFEKLPKIKIDRIQIMEVLQNIIKNAYEAMGEKGRLELAAKYSKKKRLVNISVSDTGCGLARRDLAKLGRPFFSTKTKGTGLGLALAFRIVRENHRGMIKVKSKLKKGTTFTITLPLGGAR